MKSKINYITPVAMILVLALGIGAGRADEREKQRNAYAVTSLVSDLKTGAPVQDVVLQNAWGVAFTPAGSPFWIADNATSCATLYNGDGTGVALQISIPLPGNVVPATDCKTVNPTTRRSRRPQRRPASSGTDDQPRDRDFSFRGEPAGLLHLRDGRWDDFCLGQRLTPATNAVLAVDNSKTPSVATGAVYKASPSVSTSTATLSRRQFRAGTIDVLTTTYKPATTDGGFVDPNIGWLRLSTSRVSMAICSSPTPSRTRKNA